jgi:tyrosine phenol-lyase
MDVTAESVIDVYEKRDRVRGLRFTFEPEYLRFFQARFAPTVGASIFASQSESGAEF